MHANRIWDFPETIYALELPLPVREQKAIRAEHPLHLIVNRADGFKVMFSPDYIEDGRPADALDLLDTMLTASPEKGKRVFSFSQSTTCVAARAELKGERDTDRFTTRVPRAYSLGELRREYAIAVHLADEEWEARQGKRGQNFSEKEQSRELAPHERAAALEVAHRLAEERKAEQEDARLQLQPLGAMAAGYGRRGTLEGGVIGAVIPLLDVPRPVLLPRTRRAP